MLLDRISNTTFRYKDILELDPDMSYQELHPEAYRLRLLPDP